MPTPLVYQQVIRLGRQDRQRHVGRAQRVQAGPQSRLRGEGAGEHGQHGVPLRDVGPARVPGPVVARAAQGTGAAVIIPAQLALLARTFTEPAARRRAFGVWGAMGAAGAAIGTAAGGLLAQGLGWRSIFLINLPIGVAALAGVGRLLPADPARRAMSAGRLDLPGALLGTGGLLLIGYALRALADPAARPTAAMLVVALAVPAAFVAVGPAPPDRCCRCACSESVRSPGRPSSAPSSAPPTSPPSSCWPSTCRTCSTTVRSNPVSPSCRWRSWAWSSAGWSCRRP